MSQDTFLVLGLPGSGKSTICSRVAVALDGTWLSASSVLRSHADLSADGCADWRVAWATGHSAPDVEVIPVLWNAYATARRPLILLDGYPRTADQLADFLARGGAIVNVIYLHIDVRCALARLERRSNASGRVDDSREIQLGRVCREAANIEALLEQAELGGRVIRVDATNELEPVTGDVIEAIRSASP